MSLNKPHFYLEILSAGFSLSNDLTWLMGVTDDGMVVVMVTLECILPGL